MKVAVVGSRGFKNYILLKNVLDSMQENEPISLIVSGNASGADKLGELYAQENQIPTLIYKPDWDQYGKRAGFIRNKKIVENCDKIVAFWNGESAGTKHSIDLANKMEKGLLVVVYTDDMNTFPYMSEKET